jgi:hypothetical protein
MWQILLALNSSSTARIASRIASQLHIWHRANVRRKGSASRTATITEHLPRLRAQFVENIGISLSHKSYNDRRT